MVETLLVGVIVLVATLYSAWALMPAAARRKLALRLLPLTGAAWCPRWIGRRVQGAAAGPGPGASPCDGCGGTAPRDDTQR